MEVFKYKKIVVIINIIFIISLFLTRGTIVAYLASMAWLSVSGYMLFLLRRDQVRAGKSGVIETLFLLVAMAMILFVLLDKII